MILALPCARNEEQEIFTFFPDNAPEELFETMSENSLSSDWIGQRRFASRRRLLLAVDVRARDGSALQGRILDLSETGFLFEGAVGTPVGDHLVVNLPEIGPVDAVVAWRSGEQTGCRFVTPVSKGMVSAAQLRAPALFASVAGIEHFQADEIHVRAYSPRAKLGIVAGLAGLAWGMVFGAVGLLR